MLTEGELAGELYTGSTMLTVDLTQTRDRISDPPDASTAQRVAMLYAGDERCRDHARRIAISEARRTAGCELSTPLVDLESRSLGTELRLSLDVEAQRARVTTLPALPTLTTPTTPERPTRSSVELTAMRRCP